MTHPTILQEHRLALVEPHLTPGEQVAFLQRQLPWETLPGGHIANLLCGVGAFLTVWALAAELTLPVWMRWAEGIALAVLVSAPFVAAFLARGRLFVATTQRLLILQGKKARSIASGEIRQVEHRSGLRGAGDLRLQHGQGRWETFRGVDEVDMLVRALQLLVSRAEHGDFSSQPFFRREWDDGGETSGRASAHVIYILLSLGCIVLSLVANVWPLALIALVCLIASTIDALRDRWSAGQKAVHFLEVSVDGITFCTFSKHLTKPHLRRDDGFIAFADVEEIRVQHTWRSLASQLVRARGAWIAMPSHLLVRDMAVVRFVRTVEHYRPDLIVSGDVAMLATEEA